jgi:hypothetical protein
MGVSRFWISIRIVQVTFPGSNQLQTRAKLPLGRISEMYLIGMETSESGTDPKTIGNCSHFQPRDFAATAEAFLQKAGIGSELWEGKKFAWGGQMTDSPYFKGMYMEMIRRDGQWVVTALDRSKTPLEPNRLGLREIPTA